MSARYRALPGAPRSPKHTADEVGEPPFRPELLCPDLTEHHFDMTGATR